MKVTKSTIAALFTCFMVSACSSVKQNDLVNVQMNESNYLVKDLERTYYVFEDQCIQYEQSIAEISGLNSSKPKPKYILSHKRIKCPE